MAHAVLRRTKSEDVFKQYNSHIPMTTLCNTSTPAVWPQLNKAPSLISVYHNMPPQVSAVHPHSGVNRITK